MGDERLGALRFASRAGWLGRNLADVRRRLETRVLRHILGRRVLIPEPARTHDASDLLAKTEELNQAADRYFQTQDRRTLDFWMGKPYSESAECGRYLFNVGVLLHWGRIAPGHRVLDFGAGSCWLSHQLNRFGCPTVSADVSRSAIDIGRSLFERSRETNWDLDPEFLVFDGRRLELEDGSVDRVVLHDALHHVPNVSQVLAELCRVLRDGGLVAMVEPGRRHSLTENSRQETERFGVLENDIVVEELAVMARDQGFAAVSVVPLTLTGVLEVDAANYATFLRGSSLLDSWPHQAHALLDNHFLLLYKGRFVPDSRACEGLRAEIEPLTGALQGEPGLPLSLSVRLRNSGHTTWLADGRDAGARGSVCLGVHLHDGGGQELIRDWHRIAIPSDVLPEEECVLELSARSPIGEGRYRLQLDMVSEGVCWFAQLGSRTEWLDLNVQHAPPPIGAISS